VKGNKDSISNYATAKPVEVSLADIRPTGTLNSRPLIAWRVTQFYEKFSKAIKEGEEWFDKSHAIHMICLDNEMGYITCDAQHRLQAARELVLGGFIPKDFKFTVWP
jgi:hypothetical protein